MAEAQCGGSVQTCAIRVAQLDGSGVPNPGALNLYTTDAIMKLTATPVVTKGVDMEVVNACNSPAIVYKDMDRFKRFDLTLDLIYLDAELENLLLGTEMFNTGGINLGGAAPAVAAYAGYRPGVSIEAWSKHIVNGDQDPTYPYIQWVFPRTYWSMAAVTLDNNPMPRSFTGYTSQNPNYFNGPTNDWPYASDTQMMWRMTKTIPAVACGAVALVHS